MNQRIEVILSKNSYIYDTLKNNLTENITLHVYKQDKEIKNLKKIDLLIIDFYTPEINKLAHASNIVLNLTEQQISQSEITLAKPIKLKTLLKVITEARKKQMLFCHINNSMLYHEQLAEISTQHQKTKLTEKENEILKHLLKAPNYTLSRQELQEKVWQYNELVDTNTIETHLYKLKNKLPENLLNSKSDIYWLDIKEII